MADTQQLQNAERFRKLLQSSDGAAKSILLYGGSVEVEKMFEGKKDGTEITQILSDRDAYQTVESIAGTAEQRNPQETKKDELDRATSQASRSVGGTITAAPAAVYSYFFKNPDRYSEEQLKKEADKDARDKVKAAEKAARRSKKTITDQERNALYDKYQMGFHENYLRYHRGRALQLAKTSSNPYLLAAIEDEKNRRVAPTKKSSSLQKKDISQASSAEIGNFRKDVSSFEGKMVSQKMPISKQAIPSTNPVAKSRAPGLSNRPSRSRLGRGFSNPLSKLMNPLSLLRRFLLPISITSTLIGVVLLTAVISFFFFDISDVAGGTSSDQSSGGVGGNGGGTVDGGDNIIVWAKQIADDTTFYVAKACMPHSEGRTRMVTTITNGSYTVTTREGTCDGEGGNTFYCSDLVIGAYNLAGVKNSFNSGDRSTRNMAPHWPGGAAVLMDSRSVIEQAQPGDAMFYSCGNTQSTMGHVDLIYSIDQDQLNRTNGTGRIQTIDTNTPTEFGTLTLRNWNFTNYYSLEGCSQAKYMWLGKSK